MVNLTMLSSWIADLPLYMRVPLVLGSVPVVLLSLAISYLVGLSIWRVVQLHVLHTDMYDHIPRVKHTSRKWWWIVGDLPRIRVAPPGDAHIEFAQELDSDVFLYRAMFYLPRVIMADSKALNYILGQSNSYDYPKPPATRTFLDNLLGNGLLVAEGDVHKRQRKVIQPAFNVSAMRDLTPLFFRHANAFVAKLGEIVDASKGPLDTPFIEGQSVECAKESKEQKPALDISHWYGRITLDIIGDAGFGHPFDAVRLPIDQQTDSIVDSFRSLMRMVVSISIFELIMIGMARIKFFQWTERLPTRRRRVIRQSRMALDRTGLRIIEMKRMQIVKEMQDAGAVNGEKQFFEETKRSKDLLYLMMKANMAPDVRESERMSDAELLGQITTLLTAGHETTSTLLTWFTYIISQAKHKHILQKLREEIDEHFAGRDQLDYDALMAMPYLDNCTKEILRLLSPVVNTEREASHDDVIPLGKAYKTRDGKGTFNSVAVKKGQMLFIPIQVVNRSKKIWGANADEFDPERWYDVPRMAKETGFPSHILSFLEGPRGCIGNRFAVAEFKAILCTIVRTFDFDQVADWKVERKQGVVVRPRVVGQEEVGTQLPVYLSRV